jgi:hypothetical protein
MDNLSKKLASNDKMLETISNKMESFSSAIKNKHSFNKMIESHISQLASSVPTTNLGKILGQPKELESANLVDIYYAGMCANKTEEGPKWIDWGMPAKRGDTGRPVITTTIGAYTFENALCDFGSSVDIMPKVIYEKINGSPLLYTTMCLQLADLPLCYPEGILNNICLGVGSSYVFADFAVVETGGSESAPCRMDLPGPTTSVGTRTDYSVGPWDHPACATRHLMAWSTRTAEEKYSVRKLYTSRTVWKTPRRTRLVLSPCSDL